MTLLRILAVVAILAGLSIAGLEAVLFVRHFSAGEDYDTLLALRAGVSGFVMLGLGISLAACCFRPSRADSRAADD